MGNSHTSLTSRLDIQSFNTVSGYIRLVISNRLIATVAIPRYRHLTVQIYTVHLVLIS